eukprot:GFKZ01013322.1.p1 GENE.GFKZ01013322.1~~GFKZ01013322.1.p1  ORF type:complete len:667 (-),score=80.35 GFKZ01013322.1:304-2304(-)
MRQGLAFVPPLLALLIATTLSLSTADESASPIWPVEIPIAPPAVNLIQRPVGAVAVIDTLIYIATASGQLFTADVKTGRVVLKNPGGDDQRFGGICVDSRGPKTIYATGRDSGIVFAFNLNGELLQKYQIVPHINDGGTSFLTDCIQTRYQLIIIDSYSHNFYYLRLEDEGPLRGSPPLPTLNSRFQGIEVPLAGDWTHATSGFNAFGVEWTAKFNETAYFMNAATGQLYTCAVKPSFVNGIMRSVFIQGPVKLFPGALQILFDSRNENIMYLSMPHINAVAVLEISPAIPRRAKFIRMIESPLFNGPLAVAEYGDFIYPVNGVFDTPPNVSPVYSLIRVSRHQQDQGDGEFSTTYDDVVQTPLPTAVPASEVQILIQSQPQAVGTSAPVPLGTSATQPPAEESGRPSQSTTESGSEGTDGSNSAGAPSIEPTRTPVPTAAGEAPAGDAERGPGASQRPSSVFAVNDEAEPVAEDESACFPGSATVRVEGRGVVRMDELRIGDRVLVGVDGNGEDLFSDVFFFSHRDEGAFNRFIRIITAQGLQLDISSEHYLYVNRRMASAKVVRVGDVVESPGDGLVDVADVEIVWQRGLYNPQTFDGNIVVNGIRTSTFTTAVDPHMANGLLAPLRYLHRYNDMLGTMLSALFRNGGGGLEAYIPSGKVCHVV